MAYKKSGKKIGKKKVRAYSAKKKTGKKKVKISGSRILYGARK